MAEAFHEQNIWTKVAWYKLRFNEIEGSIKKGGSIAYYWLPRIS